jgi:small subunit ribosomal protein S6
MVLNVTAPGGALDDFERTMRISDDILRHKLLRLPDAEAARRGLNAA